MRLFTFIAAGFRVKTSGILFAAALATVVLCPSVSAALSSADSTAVLSDFAAPEINFAVSIVKVTLALAITLALMVAVLWVIRRLLPFGGSPGVPGGAISILEVKYIAPKKAIALVRIADRILVVGMSEQSLTTLAELSAEEAALASGPAPESPGFSAILNRFTKGRFAAPSE